MKLQAPIAVEKYLKGMSYPARKKDLINHAKGQDAPKDVLDLMNQMPDREYSGVTDVSKAVGKIT